MSLSKSRRSIINKENTFVTERLNSEVIEKNIV